MPQPGPIDGGRLGKQGQVRRPKLTRTLRSSGSLCEKTFEKCRRPMQRGRNGSLFSNLGTHTQSGRECLLDSGSERPVVTARRQQRMRPGNLFERRMGETDHTTAGGTGFQHTSNRRIVAHLTTRVHRRSRQILGKNSPSTPRACQTGGAGRTNETAHRIHVTTWRIPLWEVGNPQLGTIV